MPAAPSQSTVAIACGGTGGHLFPGRAVGEALMERGCSVTLLISPKEVDQQAARNATGMEIVTLPAVALVWSRLDSFIGGFWKSFFVSRKLFRQRSYQAVLAMGGFTSAPPVLSGRTLGLASFLHESNVIPGRANRWLARLVDEAFIGFPQAASRLPAKSVVVTGTPVREQFCAGNPASARMALGLDAKRPVLLVMGGSQGASGINETALQSLALLEQAVPDLQYLHLTGPNDLEKVRAAYQGRKCRAVVRPFLTEMELALDAATIAVSRAGASSMAELAAMRVPSLLIPYPYAADNHQFHNALAYVETGAARMLPQNKATPDLFVRMVAELAHNESRRAAMRNALAEWHRPTAAARIADLMLDRIARLSAAPANRANGSASSITKTETGTSARRNPVALQSGLRPKPGL